MRNELLRLAVFFGRLQEKWHFSNSVLEPLDGFKNSEVKLGLMFKFPFQNFSIDIKNFE